MLPKKYPKPAPLTALPVDIDESALRTLSSVLSQNGFNYAAAISVSDALKLISLGTYDVLLRDLHMPGRRWPDGGERDAPLQSANGGGFHAAMDVGRFWKGYS
jgi:CheY-like chemotaxis protein